MKHLAEPLFIYILYINYINNRNTIIFKHILFPKIFEDRWLTFFVSAILCSSCDREERRAALVSCHIVRVVVCRRSLSEADRLKPRSSARDGNHSADVICVAPLTSHALYCICPEVQFKTLVRVDCTKVQD